MNTLKLSAAVAVDKGYVRANNEDNIYFNGKFLTADIRDEATTYAHASSDNLIVYAVFDGMGGEAYGEEASLIASKVTAQLHAEYKNEEKIDADSFVLNVINTINTAICNKMAELNSKRMGTTLAMVAIFDGKARVYNVGDSRVYHMRGSILKQVSLDDSYAQKLYRMGMITKDEAAVHKDRNKLTQHLGTNSNQIAVEPHVSEDIHLLKGDKLLICSDGLTDMLPDITIAHHMSEGKSASQITKELVAAALENGGKDNVSVIVINVDGTTNLPRPKSYGFQIALVALAIVIVIALTVGAWFFWGNKDAAQTEADLNFNVSEQLKEPQAPEEIKVAEEIDFPLAIDYKENLRLTGGKNESYLLQERIVKKYADKTPIEALEMINKDNIRVIAGENVVSVTSDAILYLNSNGVAIVYLEVDGEPYCVKITLTNVPEN